MKQWFYLTPDNQTQGPIPESNLRAMLTSGAISWETYVWDGTPQEVGGSWVMAKNAVFTPVASQKQVPDPTFTPNSAESPKISRSWRKPAVAISLFLLAAYLLFAVFSFTTHNQPKIARHLQGQGQVDTPQYNARTTISDVAEKILPSTVTINVVDSYGQGGGGSGFFVTQQGDVLTNQHVIEDASKIEIVTYANKKYSARIRAYDKERDMALLTTETPKNEIIPLIISDSEPRPGMEVVVAGSPRGFDQTISNGIVSAVRDFPDISMVQITAPISPGSSGGPVVNMSGEVIGMSRHILKDSQNLNFAVSSKHLAAFVPYAAQQPPQQLTARRSGSAPTRTQSKTETYNNIEDRFEVYPYKRLARITATNLNCREYPTVYSDVLDIIPGGAVVYALGTYTNESGGVWYYIEHEYGDYTNAWVYGRYLEFITASSSSSQIEEDDNLIFVEKDANYSVYLVKSPVGFSYDKSIAYVWTIWIPSQAQKESIAKTFNLYERPLGDFALHYIIDLKNNQGQHVSTINFYNDGSIARSYTRPSPKWERSAQNSRIRGISRVLRNYAETISIGEIAVDRATCRSGPSIKAKAIGWPERGTQVTIYEESFSFDDDRAWLRVSYVGSEKIQSGWISENLIEIFD